MKILILLVVLAGSGAAGGYFWHLRSVEKAKADLPKVQTATAETGPIKLSVLATGTMSSNLDVDIKCKSSGEIIKLPFDISDHVKKGELLLEIDPIDEQRAKDLADAALTSSTAKLAEAKQNLVLARMQVETDKGRADAAIKSAQAKADRAKIKTDRLKGALAVNAATQEDYDQAVTDWTSAIADLDVSHVQMDEIKREEAALAVKEQDIQLAQAQVKSDTVAQQIAQQHLDECKVYAPMDAVVAARPVQIGQIIASAISNVGGGTTVMTISDLSRVFSMANVDESDIGKVKVGQLVDVTADSYPGKKFSGKVTRIATTGVNVSNVVTFQVQIEILDTKKILLKPQMTTNVEIIAAEKADALIVPNDAVFHKKAEKFVTVQKPDGTTEDRAVKTGINDGDRSEITDGVKQGEVVIIRKGAADKWAGGNRPPGTPTVLGGGRGR